ncbi:MAG: hypothetical protein IJY15_09590 [Thermoguttaceae bacterium]|nr:hypothetical protein [Thermoguttaceae bacterium]
MFDSIWSRPSWEIFAFFAFGTALASTVCARAALRLGSDYPRRRPILFGAEVGAALGLALWAYLWASTNPRFDEIDGAALSVWEKARLVGAPTTKVVSFWFKDGCEGLCGAALVAQTACVGAFWGATGLRRCVACLEERKVENDVTKQKKTSR